MLAGDVAMPKLSRTQKRRRRLQQQAIREALVATAAIKKVAPFLDLSCGTEHSKSDAKLTNGRTAI